MAKSKHERLGPSMLASYAWLKNEWPGLGMYSHTSKTISVPHKIHKNSISMNVHASNFFRLKSYNNRVRPSCKHEWPRPFTLDVLPFTPRSADCTKNTRKRKNKPQNAPKHLPIIHRHAKRVNQEI